MERKEMIKHSGEWFIVEKFGGNAAVGSGTKTVVNAVKRLSYGSVVCQINEKTPTNR